MSRAACVAGVLWMVSAAAAQEPWAGPWCRAEHGLAHASVSIPVPGAGYSLDVVRGRPGDACAHETRWQEPGVAEFSGIVWTDGVGRSASAWEVFICHATGGGVQARVLCGTASEVFHESSGPVSRIACRCQGEDLRYAEILERFDRLPRVRSFREGPDGWLEVGGERFVDAWRVDPWESRVAFVGRALGEVARVVAVNESRIENDGEIYVSGEWPLHRYEARYDGSALDIEVGTGYGQVLVWGPRVETLKVNGVARPVEKMGGMCILTEEGEDAVAYWPAPSRTLQRGVEHTIPLRLFNPGPRAWRGQVRLRAPEGADIPRGLSRARSQSVSLEPGEGAHADLLVEIPRAAPVGEMPVLLVVGDRSLPVTLTISDPGE